MDGVRGSRFWLTLESTDGVGGGLHPYPASSCLLRRTPPIGYTASGDYGQLHFSTLFNGLTALRYANPRSLYVRIDQATSERTFVAHYDRTDGYYRARDGEGHYVGRPARARNGSKGMFPTIFGRPSPLNRTVPPNIRMARGVTDPGYEAVSPAPSVVQKIRALPLNQPNPQPPFDIDVALPLSHQSVVHPVAMVAGFLQEVHIQLLVDLSPRLQGVFPSLNITPRVPSHGFWGPSWGRWTKRCRYWPIVTPFNFKCLNFNPSSRPLKQRLTVGGPSTFSSTTSADQTVFQNDHATIRVLMMVPNPALRPSYSFSGLPPSFPS